MADHDRGHRFQTLLVHGRYDHEEALTHHGAICEPAYITPAQHFDTMEDMRLTLLGKQDGWTYTRLGNPTVTHLEQAIALLESYGTDEEVGSTVFSSGMAAIFMTANALLPARDTSLQPNFVLPSGCYGGTYKLFSERYAKDYGVELRWIQDTLDLDQWESAIDAQTRMVFCEMPTNPHLYVTDIRALSEIVDKWNVPLVVDATLASPALMRPIGMGADIVIHSASKSMSASGLSIAGVVSSKADIRSRHIVKEAKADFAGFLKRGPQRDMGVLLSPFNALMTLADLRSLRERTDAMSRNAMAVARYLESHEATELVRYPGLESHPGHDIAKRDMRLVDSGREGEEDANRYGYLLAFNMRSGDAAAKALLDSLNLFWRANDVGRMKSAATMPAIATHSHLSESQKREAGVDGTLVRLSIGCEDADDLIGDLEQGFQAKG